MIALGCSSPDANSDAPSGEQARVGAWNVSDPVLAIGQEGIPEYEFGNVIGVGHLDNGEWVLYDGGSRQLRFYNAEGVFQRSAGRAGEGPGEFRDVHYMEVLNGDRIVTYDQQLRRLTEWDRRGRVRQTRRVAAQPGGSVLRPVGFVDSTTLVWMNFTTPECRLSETLTDTVTYYATSLHPRADVTAADIRPLIGMPGGLSWGSSRNILGRCIPQRIPMAPGPVDAASSAALFVATRRGVTLTRYDLGTRERAEINLPLAARALTHDVKEAHIRNALGAADRDEAGRPLPANAGMDLFERRLRELPWPDSLPAVDQLIADAHGLLWLRSSPGPADTAALWVVLSPQGNTVTRALLPRRIRVIEIGDDYVAGVETDALGVQRVVVRNLRRGGVDYKATSGA